MIYSQYYHLKLSLLYLLLFASQCWAKVQIGSSCNGLRAEMINQALVDGQAIAESTYQRLRAIKKGG